jgi:hypothetical protein
MTKIASSVPVTSGSGNNIASHTFGSREYQAVVDVDQYGYIRGTARKTYVVVPAQAIANSKEMFEVFNAAANVALRLLSCRMIREGAAVAATDNTTAHLRKTSTVGTDGTGASNNSLDATLMSLNTDDGIAVTSGVTGRLTSTDATLGTIVGKGTMTAEESYGESEVELVRGGPIVIPSGSGFLVAMGAAVATTGSIGFMAVFEEVSTV